MIIILHIHIAMADTSDTITRHIFIYCIFNEIIIHSKALVNCLDSTNTNMKMTRNVS